MQNLFGFRKGSCSSSNGSNGAGSPNKHGKSTTSDNFQQTAKHATGGHLMTLISELTREKNYESLKNI